MRFLIAWIVPAWLVFEAAPTKLPHYPLPLYPAVCLLMATGVVAGMRAWGWVGAALAAAITAVFAASGVGAAVFLGLDPWLGAPCLAAALIVGWFAVRVAHERAALAAIMASVLLYAAVLGWELPRLWPLWIAPRVVASVPTGRLGSVGFAEPSLMVLAGTGTQFLLPVDGVQALADGSVDVLLVGDRDLAAVQAGLLARSVATHVVGIVPGFNYSRGRRVVLTALAR